MGIAASAHMGLGHGEQSVRKFLQVRSMMDERPAILSWYWAMPIKLGLPTRISDLRTCIMLARRQNGQLTFHRGPLASLGELWLLKRVPAWQRARATPSERSQTCKRRLNLS